MLLLPLLFYFPFVNLFLYSCVSSSTIPAFPLLLRLYRRLPSFTSLSFLTFHRLFPYSVFFFVFFLKSLHFPQIHCLIPYFPPFYFPCFPLFSFPYFPFPPLTSPISLTSISSSHLSFPSSLSYFAVSPLSIRLFIISSSLCLFFPPLPQVFEFTRLFFFSKSSLKCLSSPTFPPSTFLFPFFVLFLSFPPSPIPILFLFLSNHIWQRPEMHSPRNPFCIFFVP